MPNLREAAARVAEMVEVSADLLRPEMIALRVGGSTRLSRWPTSMSGEDLNKLASALADLRKALEPTDAT